ncbi:MAG: polysaccharide biosynthesis C-terminal domain-containing protein [Acidobacteriaceae bacterium]|nr:polysaccharide biosynthesis C-terminal domain-containing protein [Acidobacteriaceae bacterium]
MRESAGDREGTLRVFQSCWWLITAACSTVGLLLGPVVYFAPIDKMLKLTAIQLSDARWIIFYLGIAVLLGQLEQLLGAAYTCIARYAEGSFYKSIISLLAFAAMIIPVMMHKGARTTALVYALANIVGTIILAIKVRYDIPWLRFGWQHASWNEIKRMSGPAIAFLGFPLGNAFNLQGTVLAVQYALGPLDVVIFSTARQVSRVALQMVQMVNSTFWPELSLAFGAKNWDLVKLLHRRSCQLALGIALALVAAMMSFGPWFLTHWTAGHVPPSKGLLAILLGVVVCYSLWSTSSTLLAATNQHQKLSVYYIIATGLTVIFTYVLARHYGLFGAASSLILGELIMNYYVLPTSLKLTHDNLPDFIRSLWDIPESVRPAALLRRILRTSRPAEEEQ